jgi:Bacterial regulatory proteins, gntR family
VSAPTGIPREIRWPLRPLLDACELTPTALGRRVGASGNAMAAARRHGLTDVQADHWAIALGTHPLLVWGWAWIDDANHAHPSHLRLAAVLRDQIERGEMRPGDQVPSAAALAARWGVGSKTAARAVAQLRIEGLVAEGGRGRANVVAAALPAGSARCAVCGQPIEAGSEHYPHRTACQLAARGWCDCDGAAHPECCPTCAAGAA